MMQKISNLLGSIFYKMRYSKIHNPFVDFEQMKMNLSFKKDNYNKGIILITPIRVSPTSNLLEGLFGTFLKIKGYDVKYLLCNQALSHCENISNLNKKCVTCSLCLKEQNVFTRVFKADIVRIEDYVNSETKKKISRLVNNRGFIEPSDFIYKGVDLRDEIESGVMRYTQKSDIIITEDIAMVRRCAITSFILCDFLMSFAKKNKIYRLISSHGIYSSWGAILKTSQVLHVPSVIWGRGYIGIGNLLFGHNYAIQDDLRRESDAVFKDIELTNDKIQVVKDYFFKKENPNSNVDYVNYYQGIISDTFDIPAFYEKIKKYDKVFGMFTNIPWDGQIFNKTDYFPTTRIYINYTLDWFRQHPNNLLVIRAHPAEVSRKDSKQISFRELLAQESPTLPDNVVFLDSKNPITSYELARHIDCAIMYGSSMAIEIALRKIPVVHTGYTYISNKGIVFDVTTKEDYFNKLDIASRGELVITDKMYNNALKYGYYWLKLRNIPDTTVNLKGLAYDCFKFSNEKEFIEDELLNLMFDCLVNNKRFLYNEV